MYTSRPPYPSVALPSPSGQFSIPYYNGSAYAAGPTTGGGGLSLSTNDAVNGLAWRQRMPSTNVFGTNFLPQNTGQLLGANDGTITYSVYGQEAYVSQGSNILKMRAKLSPTADPTQLSVGSSDGFYGPMEVWATGSGLYVYSASNLDSPRSFWWMVNANAMVTNVPIDNRAGDVIVHGTSVTLSLPAGKTTAVYEVVFNGNNEADERYVLPALITISRNSMGVITGYMTPFASWPVVAPSWLSEAPALEIGTNSIDIALDAAGTWQTTVRTRALTNV